MQRQWMASLLVCLLVGCGMQESSPVPQPVPFYLRRSTPSASAEPTATLLVGLPRAVAGAGKVRGRVAAGPEALAPASAAGSFALLMTARIDERIELRFETAEGVSDPLFVDPGAYSLGPRLQGTRGPGVVSAPDAKGLVTVSNDGGVGQPPLLEASPDADLLTSNAGSGEVVSVRTDRNGIFKTQIAAGHGDTIRLLLVDAASTAATSDFLTYTVP